MGWEGSRTNHRYTFTTSLNMKIRIAFLWNHNNQWIWGGDRKFGIYFRNLSEQYFDKYFVHLTTNTEFVQIIENEVILVEDELLPFLESKNIDYVYFSGAKISKNMEWEILKKYTWLINVNFTPCYSADPKKLNLIISKTDYWKLRWIHGELNNAHVVYNPIDFENWDNLAKTTMENYRDTFAWKKYILGRLARAEPSKWHFLILATLWKLDREKNYQYGFIFAGIPRLYRNWIEIFLSKKMRESILFLPELRKYEDIAKFYHSIDIFWQTSWIWESFGNVIAEAFCFKIPVITDFKHFYKNGKVNARLYDAQIELVDHKKNGAYCIYPESIICFLDTLTPRGLKAMWKSGYEKVKNIYNVRFTSDTMAKILYLDGRKRLWYEQDDNFEKLQQIPSDKEIQEYENEYIKRIDIWEEFNRISWLKKIGYSLFGNIWRGIEYVYLIIRVLLKKFVKVDIEKL